MRIVLAAVLVMLWGSVGLAARAPAQAGGTPPSSPPSGAPSTPEAIRAAAEEHLKFLYSMYFAVRGCAEAVEQHGNADYRPTVSLADARGVMAKVDAAAKEVGVDIEKAWLEASPVGEITAQSLKEQSPGNLEKCRSSGRYFRLVLSRLQTALTGLGSKHSIIERDY